MSKKYIHKKMTNLTKNHFSDMIMRFADNEVCR